MSGINRSSEPQTSQKNHTSKNDVISLGAVNRFP